MMKKILLIEDEDGIAEGIRDALLPFGFEVSHASSSENGEKLLNTESLIWCCWMSCFPAAMGSKCAGTYVPKG